VVEVDLHHLEAGLLADAVAGDQFLVHPEDGRALVLEVGVGALADSVVRTELVSNKR
jgi:hypothetical protein